MCNSKFSHQPVVHSMQPPLFAHAPPTHTHQPHPAHWPELSDCIPAAVCVESDTHAVVAAQKVAASKFLTPPRMQCSLLSPPPPPASLFCRTCKMRVCVCDPSPLSPCRPLNHTHNPTCSTSHHTPHPPTKTQHNTLAQSRHCRNSCRCSQGHTRNMLALPTHPRLLLFQQGILSAAKAASNPHTPTKPCAPFLRPSPSVQSTIYLLACSAFQRLMAGPWCVCILTSDAGTAQHSAT